MLTIAEHDEYLAEVREHVCRRCIERGRDCPPCGSHDHPCGIEAHLPELVALCRTTDSLQMADYLDKLHDVICPQCEYKDTSGCPCPLDYLLQLAVEAVEAVDYRRDLGAGI
jgi:hypothetical protein